MQPIVSRSRRGGWLLLDLAGTGLLALGILALVAPDSAAKLGLPAFWGWPLIVAGAVATSIAMLLFVRQARAAREA